MPNPSATALPPVAPRILPPVALEARRGETACNFVAVENRPAPVPVNRLALATWAARGGAEPRGEAVRAVVEYRRDPDAVHHALDLRRMGLTELPPLPKAALIDARENPLKTLPASLPDVSSFWIDLDRTLFSAGQDALLVRSHPALARIPYVQIGVPNPWKTTGMPPHVIAALWSPEPAQCAVAAQWLAHEGEPHAGDFADFMKATAMAIATAVPAGAQASIGHGIAVWLHKLLSDPERRAAAFAAAGAMAALDHGEATPDLWRALHQDAFRPLLALFDAALAHPEPDPDRPDASTGALRPPTTVA